MKKLIVIISLIVSVTALLPLTSYPQWEMSTGLEGAEITDMVSVDSVLIAISPDRGIYRKVDTGNWEICNGNTTFSDITVAGNCVIASNKVLGSIRSFDYGMSWEDIPVIDEVYQFLSNDTVIFSGFLYEYRSFDYGDTYDTIIFPMPREGNYTWVLSDDSLLYTHFWDLYDLSHYLFYSDDYGESWNVISTDELFIEPEIEIKQIKHLNGTFWVQLRSMNSGYVKRLLYVFDYNDDKWINVTNNLPSWSWHNDIFGLNGKIYCSVDNFPVFQFVYSDSSWIHFVDDSKVVNKFLNHENELFCATDQGACSLDTTGNWITYNSGLFYRQVSSIDEINNTIFLTANNELFRSEDGGDSFTRLENGFGFNVIVTDSVLYTVSPYEFRMSRDEGYTWHSFSDGLKEYYDSQITCLSISSVNYFVGTGRGLYRSSVDSISWIKVIDAPFYEDYSIVNIVAIDSSVIVSVNGRFYISYDYGNTFSDYSESSVLRKAKQTYYQLKNTILYSDDLAFSWKNIPTGLTGFNGSSIDSKGDTIIFGGRDYYSTPIIKMTYDYGASWIDLVDDLPYIYEYESNHGAIRTLKIIDGRVLVGNPKYGLWYRDDILTGITQESLSDRANKYPVSVYPNPFTTSTTLSYDLQQPSPVQISIYNHLGEQVELIQQNQPQGKQQVTWNAEGLQSGIYFYRMQAGDQVASGKMVLVR